ncbi:MAG: radical SAM protein, partial [Spirochaetia bacterium]|nr:radical SAM protein [Spirochaetia bacterium]
MKLTKQLLSNAIINEAYKYIAHNPMENLPKLIDWADRLIVEKDYKETTQMFRKIAKDPSNNWNQLIQRYFNELNTVTQKKFLINFFVNSGIVGNTIIEKNKKKYDCELPWAILFDPTAACNLKCTGCWAAEYGKGISLDYATMQKIIMQGKELGIHMYVLSGGEPTVRKTDIIKLAEENNDCMFLSFTNATLIDEAFASEIERIGNFAFAISVEGFEEETDMRRGTGTY